jgi:hemerythrin-like metal-binding protein
MPKYIIWKEEYSVSDDIADMQHKRIIDIISGVFALVKNKSSGERIGELLADLKMYTETHFEYEEKMMRMAAYPDIENHEKLHSAMTQRTAAMCLAQKNSNNGIMPEEVLDFLKDWWVNHIRNIDMQYAPFVSKSNSKE